MNLRIVCAGFALALAVGAAPSQTIEQLQQRLGAGASSPGLPMRGADIPLVEKPWEKISDQQLFDHGKVALGYDPKAWKHAETDHFVVHYRRMTDAKKVVRQAEFYYQQIKSDLQVTQDRFDRKNHIFVFEKAPEWQQFLSDARINAWAAGVASRSELFFLSRQHDDFAAGTLAHEITHCIFYRFVGKPIPLWLNEGFAEFESGNAYAKFKGIGGGKRGSGKQGAANFPLRKLLEARVYPEDKEQIQEFYRTSERLVRFLLTKLDRKQFVPLAMKLADGASLETAVMEIYPGKFKSFDEFVERYQKFD
ncbi:MAG: hypothetical protein N2689_07345 [Verrucomicrobiae bacterium]|nr:hypothetical protein [Verrucomicrobiae bacterium]